MMTKFLFFVFLFNISYAFALFKSSDCVVRSFQGSYMIKKGPFGILPSSMRITKNRCIIDIEKKMVSSNSWQIDLCREPVHIKQKTWTGDSFQIRKSYPCKENTLYCEQVDELINSIENDALIYALGERESLTTDHGKFFCAYLLLKNYLKEGKVFSLTVPTSVNIFEKTSLESFGREAPIVVPEVENTVVPSGTPVVQLTPETPETPVSHTENKAKAVKF